MDELGWGGSNRSVKIVGIDALIKLLPFIIPCVINHGVVLHETRILSKCACVIALTMNGSSIETIWRDPGVAMELGPIPI